MSIGATLRQAREQAGLTLDQVSQVTRVRTAVLEALERDDWSACGGDVYAKGHIKSYARAVGLDGAELLASGGTVAPRPAIDETVMRPAPVNPTTQVVSTPEPIPIRSVGQAFESEKRAATSTAERSGPNWSAVMAAALAVIVVLGVVGIVARGSSSGTTPAATSTTKSAAPTSARPATSSVAPSAATSPVRPTSPTATSPTSTLVAQRPTGDGVTVVITATGSSWIQANTGRGGSVIWEGTLEEGDTKTVTNDKKVRLVIGNGGAVELVVNGRDIGSPGSEGEVVKVEFGPGDPTSATG